MSNKTIVGGGNYKSNEARIPNTVLRLEQGDNGIQLLVYDPSHYYDGRWHDEERLKLIEHECKVIPGLKMLDCRAFCFSTTQGYWTSEDRCIFIILSETIEGDKQFLHTIHYLRTFDKYTDPRDIYGSSQDGDYNYDSEIDEYPINGPVYVIGENNIVYTDCDGSQHMITVGFNKTKEIVWGRERIYEIFSIENTTIDSYECADEFKISHLSLNDDESNLTIGLNYKEVGEIKVTAKVLNSNGKLRFENFEAIDCNNLILVGLVKHLNENLSDKKGINIQCVFSIILKFVHSYLSSNPDVMNDYPIAKLVDKKTKEMIASFDFTNNTFYSFKKGKDIKNDQEALYNNYKKMLLDNKLEIESDFANMSNLYQLLLSPTYKEGMATLERYNSRTNRK